MGSAGSRHGNRTRLPATSRVPWSAMAVTTAHEAPSSAGDRRARVITPEAVVLEFETAGVASRLLARLVDGLVIWAMLFGMAIILGAGGPIQSEALAIIVVVITIFFAVFGYWMVFETLLGGRTLGKMALGLRVVTVEGAPVRFRHSAIRAMLGVVDFLVPPLGPVAVVSVLVSPNDQRLGDLAAGTIVLRERAADTTVNAVHAVEPPGRHELMGRLQLARLSDAQYGVIRRFLLRTPSLSVDARADLGARLATATEAVVEVARPPDLHPEWYLHAVALAHQRRTGFAPMPGANSNPPPPAGTPVHAGAPVPAGPGSSLARPPGPPPPRT